MNENGNMVGTELTPEEMERALDKAREFIMENSLDNNLIASIVKDKFPEFENTFTEEDTKHVEKLTKVFDQLIDDLRDGKVRSSFCLKFNFSSFLGN